MAETLLKFQTPVKGPDGIWYEAKACGSEMPGGTWQGWIEFAPADRIDEAIRTPRETTQPNRADTTYWATGLSGVYLEGALKRALTAPRFVAPASPEPAIFDRPAPDVFPAALPLAATNAVSVLNPFSVYEKGEAFLRKQLAALSAWHLVNIIRDYDLSRADPAVLSHMPAAELVELIVAAIEKEAGPAPIETHRR